MSLYAEFGKLLAVVGAGNGAVVCNEEELLAYGVAGKGFVG